MASIGQYRFKGTGTCVSSVASEKSYLNTATVGAGETSTSFQDIQIITNQQLQANRDYYLYSNYTICIFQKFSSLIIFLMIFIYYYAI